MSSWYDTALKTAQGHVHVGFTITVTLELYWSGRRKVQSTVIFKVKLLGTLFISCYDSDYLKKLYWLHFHKDDSRFSVKIFEVTTIWYIDIDQNE